MCLRWTAADMLEAERQLGKITAATATSPSSPSPSSASRTVTRLRSHASLRESITGPRPKFHDARDILQPAPAVP
jgi:hypothetical protein